MTSKTLVVLAASALRSSLPFLMVASFLFSSVSEAAKKGAAANAKQTAKPANVCSQLILPADWYETRKLRYVRPLKATDSLAGKQFSIIPVDPKKGWVFGNRIGKLTKKNREYLIQQIENFNHLNGLIRANYQGFDYVTRTLEYALMLKWHALLTGGPGGAKTDIASRLVAAPVTMKDGKRANVSFRLLLHQMMSDIEIRGVTNINDMMSWNGSNDPKNFVQNRNTLMTFRRILLDEVEKASGKPLQALNDILSQRQAFIGPFALQAQVETVFGTTNLVPASFVHNFHMLGLRSTAEPFLDRFPFKIWVANYLAQPEERRMLMLGGIGNTTFRAFQTLADPSYVEPPQRPIVVTDESSLPEVDWPTLGAVAFGSTYFRPDLLYVLEELVHEMRAYFNKEAIDDEADASLEDRAARRYPPNLVSNRTLYNLAIQTIIISSFHELLSLSEAGLEPEDIVQMIEDGIPLDRFSIWRISNLLMYSAPGNPKLAIKWAKTTPTIEIAFGNDVELLRDVSYSLEERAFLDSVIRGRERFSTLFNAKMSATAFHGQKMAERLRGITGIRGSQDLERHSLELWLLGMGQKLGSP